LKRFWSQAAVVREVAHFAIRLDARPMRLPGGPLLALRSEALAVAIAQEWQDAPETFTPEDVPMTRIAGTAQERVTPDPGTTIEALLKYGGTDLLCYEAEGPADLVRRQEKAWLPWLEWAATRYDARLRRAQGVMPIDQPAEAMAALRMAVARHPPFVLAGLGILVPATGSLILGLAVAEGALGAADAHALAALDELYEAEKWGDDLEAVARRRNVAADIADAARFIALSGSPG
jgi:chaperone required for assembly of F1-ATPase